CTAPPQTLPSDLPVSRSTTLLQYDASDLQGLVCALGDISALGTLGLGHVGPLILRPDELPSLVHISNERPAGGWLLGGGDVHEVAFAEQITRGTEVGNATDSVPLFHESSKAGRPRTRGRPRSSQARLPGGDDTSVDLTLGRRAVHHVVQPEELLGGADGDRLDGERVACLELCHRDRRRGSQRHRVFGQIL